MVTRRIDAGGNSKPQRPPAVTPEARELELQSLAFDLAEKQLRDGTASAQVQVHFLKANSERDRLEKERLRQDNLLAEARIQQIHSTTTQESLLKAAMAAFSEYRGDEVQDSA